MSKLISGGGDRLSQTPAGDTNPGETDKDWTVAVPVMNDPAQVPADMETLARGLIKELDLRLTEAAAYRAYQGKIRVEYYLPDVTTVAEGGIVFVIV